MGDDFTVLADTLAAFHDAPEEAFDRASLTVVETSARTVPYRNLSDWDRWVRHVWFTKLDDAVVCSVDPRLADAVREPYHARNWPTLVNPTAVVQADRPIDSSRPAVADATWIQREILWYPDDEQPRPPLVDDVERLRPGDPGADEHLHPEFDGGVFVYRTEDETIAAHAGIKDKGDVQEIAVGTEPDYRQRGYGKAVVAAAIGEVRARGAVPTYHPGPLSNHASYALAHSLGFEKIGEEMALETDTHAADQ